MTQCRSHLSLGMTQYPLYRGVCGVFVCVYVYAHVHSTTSYAPDWRKIQCRLAKRSYSTFPSCCQYVRWSVSWSVSYRRWMHTTCEKCTMLNKGCSVALLLQTMCHVKKYHKKCSKKVPHQCYCAQEYTEEWENSRHSVLGKKT